MEELVTDLPSGPLTVADCRNLRARQSVRSVIELPTPPESRRGETRRATVLVEGTVVSLEFDAESERWTQTTLAHDADRHQLLKEALKQLDER
jgi:hypothetical protein